MRGRAENGVAVFSPGGFGVWILVSKKPLSGLLSGFFVWVREGDLTDTSHPVCVFQPNIDTSSKWAFVKLDGCKATAPSRLSPIPFLDTGRRTTTRPRDGSDGQPPDTQHLATCDFGPERMIGK